MKAKVLKAQFNELCLGGMILDMQSVTLHSGPNKMNGIELSQKGINIQKPKYSKYCDPQIPE